MVMAKVVRNGKGIRMYRNKQTELSLWRIDGGNCTLSSFPA